MIRRAFPEFAIRRKAIAGQRNRPLLEGVALLRRDEDFLAWWLILSSQLIATSITLMALAALISEI